uniref:NADH-ubiquinone oxidoreductase chain 6 n=1 Tax=Elminae sp. GENSP01 TaxID=1205551 RepID=A0A0S2MMX5_9COLE|nr:NADH deshydrogenase subunit 6 [Elminae sp. GENSP01]
MSFLAIMSISTSLLFMFLKHPMSMGLSLLIQSTIISLMTGFHNHNFWFSYILFLIMIGGMLVLFIYMTSIASNEMFKYSNKLMIMMILCTTIMIIMTMMWDQYFMNQNTFTMDMTAINNKEMFKLSLNKYLNFPSNMMLFFMIIYLFITLIAVVKITNIQYGPLRQKP